MVAGVIPIIVTTMGTFAGKYFQDRNEALKQRRDRLQELIPKVNTLLDSISSEMNSLSYLADQAMYALVFRNESVSYRDKPKKANSTADTTAWDNYTESLISWQKSRTSYVAKATTYFGDEVAARIKEVNAGFDAIDEQLKATYYERADSQFYIEDKKGSKNDFRTKYLEPKNQLEEKIQAINIEMVAIADKLQDSNK